MTAAVGALRLSRYHVISPRFVDDRDGAGRRVVFATRSAEVRVLGDLAWECVSTGRVGELEDETIADLAGIELLVPEDEDELASVLLRTNIAIDANPVLSLVVCPTASCQLGCPYCGQEHSRRWLSEAHQTAFLKMAEVKLARGHYEAVQLCWFGAEPLLQGCSTLTSLVPSRPEVG